MCETFQVVLNSLVMKHRAVIPPSWTFSKDKEKSQERKATWGHYLVSRKPRKRHSSGTDSSSRWTSSLPTVRNCICCFTLLVLGVLSRFPWEVAISVNQKPAPPITSYSYNLINIAPPAEMGGRLMSRATEQCPPVLWDKSELGTPAPHGLLKAMGPAAYTKPSLQRVLPNREMVMVKRKTCRQGAHCVS